MLFAIEERKIFLVTGKTPADAMLNFTKHETKSEQHKRCVKSYAVIEDTNQVFAVKGGSYAETEDRQRSSLQK
jgi:hypothetical protein